MKIRVLGCSGAEFPGHNPPGFLLDNEILFDAGSLTNVLTARGQQRIRKIFITHAHLDHIRGIPFLADNLIIRNYRDCNFEVLSIPPVIRTIRRNLLNGSVWPDFTVIPEPRNGILKLSELREGAPLRLGRLTITPYSVSHSVPAVGYLVEDAKGKRLFYSGDTGPTRTTWKKIGRRQLHCLIIEVSFPNRMEKTALITGHLTTSLLKEELPRILPPPERVLITHTKPQYYAVIKGELARLGMKNLRILRDGETITI